jgi:hypothetical protein
MIVEQFCGSKINKLINQSLIREIYSFVPLAKTLKLATKDALVIFDIDDVLIMPSADDDFRHPYRTQLWGSITNRLTSKKKELLDSNILSRTKKILVESQIINIFNNLKLLQIPTIALTAMGTGNFGIIKNMEDLRFKELNSVGISFKSLTPLLGEQLAPELTGTNIVSKHCTGTPKLQEGIIFTAGVDKGVVLEYMFSKYNYCPKAIIFIDDVLENIKSLQKLCIKLKIDFCGFHYKAVSLMPLPVIDENLERLRFNILEKDCGWLNYEKLKKKYVKYNSCDPLNVNNFLSLDE